jgi:hypothetical protein
MGDKVTVKLGYEEYAIETVFKGYIKQVSTTVPLVISCENEAYKLKRISVQPETIKQFDIDVFCNKYLIDHKNNVTPSSFGEVKISADVNFLEVLNYLKKEYGFLFYFREDETGTTFYGGLTQTEIMSKGKSNTVVFRIGRNVVSSSLKFTLKEDIKIQIVARNILKDNKKIEIKYPAVVGEGYSSRTYHWAECQTEAELMEKAKANYEAMKEEMKEAKSFNPFADDLKDKELPAKDDKPTKDKPTKEKPEEKNLWQRIVDFFV